MKLFSSFSDIQREIKAYVLFYVLFLPFLLVPRQPSKLLVQEYFDFISG